MLFRSRQLRAVPYRRSRARAPPHRHCPGRELAQLPSCRPGRDLPDLPTATSRAATTRERVCPAVGSEIPSNLRGRIPHRRQGRIPRHLQIAIESSSFRKCSRSSTGSTMIPIPKVQSFSKKQRTLMYPRRSCASAACSSRRAARMRSIWTELLPGLPRLGSSLAAVEA